MMNDGSAFASKTVEPMHYRERPMKTMLDLFEVHEAPLTPSDSMPVAVAFEPDWDDVPIATPSARRVWASEE